jgi:hypothetical protein
MDREYLRSVWEDCPETRTLECLEEAYANRGFAVKNFHRDDRVNERGKDVLCTRIHPPGAIAFAVKKKPKKGDVQQLRELATQNPGMVRVYVYLSPPTAPFRAEMDKWKAVYYLDWEHLHLVLVESSAIGYLGQYFSVHPLVSSLSDVLRALYDSREVRFRRHRADRSEQAFLWSAKDDAVKLKAMLQLLRELWSPELKGKLRLDPSEYPAYVERLHQHLAATDSIAGVRLRDRFVEMKRTYPGLLGQYWDIASQRTGWKDFTSRASEIGMRSGRQVADFVVREWAVPGAKLDSRRSVYAALECLLDRLYGVAKDIEEGIDWLHDDLVA